MVFKVAAFNVIASEYTTIRATNAILKKYDSFNL